MRSSCGVGNTGSRGGAPLTTFFISSVPLKLSRAWPLLLGAVPRPHPAPAEPSLLPGREGAGSSAIGLSTPDFVPLFAQGGHCSGRISQPRLWPSWLRFIQMPRPCLVPPTRTALAGRGLVGPQAHAQHTCLATASATEGPGLPHFLASALPELSSEEGLALAFLVNRGPGFHLERTLPVAEAGFACVESV